MAKTIATITHPSSRCLSRIRHNARDNVLDVTFAKSGAEYRYHGVSKRVANNLRNADSVGGHFVRNVRNNYPTSKLRAGFKGGRKNRKKGGR